SPPGPPTRRWRGCVHDRLPPRGRIVADDATWPVGAEPVTSYLRVSLGPAAGLRTGRAPASRRPQHLEPVGRRGRLGVLLAAHGPAVRACLPDFLWGAALGLLDDGRERGRRPGIHRRPRSCGPRPVCGLLSQVRWPPSHPAGAPVPDRQLGTPFLV